MTQLDPTLRTIYDGWKTYQKFLIDAISPLTAEQLQFRAAPKLWSVYELLTHIIGVRYGWFHFTAGFNFPDLEKIPDYGDPKTPIASAQELVNALEITMNMIQNVVETWTADQLVEPVDDEGTIVTRQWIIWHVIEHDLHHGGEVSFSIGMHGLPGLNL